MSLKYAWSQQVSAPTGKYYTVILTPHTHFYLFFKTNKNKNFVLRCNGMVLTQALNKQINGVHVSPSPYIRLNTFITQLSS